MLKSLVLTTVGFVDIIRVHPHRNLEVIELLIRNLKSVILKTLLDLGIVSEEAILNNHAVADYLIMDKTQSGPVDESVIDEIEIEIE